MNSTRLATFIASLALVLPAIAGSSATDLRKSTPCCWETQFRQGTADCAPRGATRGTVLYADGTLPRLQARMQGMVWKGKTFHCDGTFTNRWMAGVRAGGASTHIEPSWLDGQPCIVMQYSGDATVFANVRDELRQIGPNLWLGRSYDACTHEPKNWFALCGDCK